MSSGGSGGLRDRCCSNCGLVVCSCVDCVRCDRGSVRVDGVVVEVGVHGKPEKSGVVVDAGEGYVEQFKLAVK